MKIEEIRIGNKISFRGEELTISSIIQDEHDKNVYRIECSEKPFRRYLFNEDVKPIEITEQHLKELNFSPDVINEDSGFRQYNKKLRGNIITADLYLVENRSYEIEIFFNMVLMKNVYFHQLQNLITDLP